MRPLIKNGKDTSGDRKYILVMNGRDLEWPGSEEIFNQQIVSFASYGRRVDFPSSLCNGVSLWGMLKWMQTKCK